MKKVLIFYALLVVVVVAFALSRGTNLLNFGGGGGSDKTTAKIHNTTYKLILAKTNEEKQKGLSGRNSLAKDSGMLFVFGKKEPYAFWMRDMKFPIDIIWIDGNKIVDYVENAPAASSGQSPSNLTVYKPEAPADYVLEVNANEISKNKIKRGDTVTLTGVK